ncbi:hypothetical protein [Lewinella sp. W8]|uniref:hypothetical protein n=1 Tax=Lewinella sp. W8 TaxID=2528208 RepID=UPI001067319C|nr:hypothetical protein [Lewinella sp. W8]MTB53603.1 hypothetical protein [Lewinella sp. W8]
MRSFLLTALAAALYSCAPAPTTADALLGRWNMIGVKIYEEDVAPQLNPAGDRWLDFAADGTFSSGSGELRENGGTYTYRPETGAVSLDSDAGVGDDSNWTVTFRGDTLLMRGVGTERQENSEVILVR